VANSLSTSRARFGCNFDCTQPGETLGRFERTVPHPPEPFLRREATACMQYKGQYEGRCSIWLRHRPHRQAK
jgi:hypothetical protein